MKSRVATRKDVKQIAQILSEAYISLDSSSDLAEEAYFSELKRGYHYVVTEHNGRIIGLSAWFYHGLPKHGLIEIDRFAVLPSYRRKKVATQLFIFLLKNAQDFFRPNGRLRKVFLFTRAENKIAHAFYRSLGFVKEGEAKRHFYDGKDDYIFSYYLNK